MNKIKVGIITDSLYPYFIGGAPQRCWEIGKRLAMLNHEVHVFTMNWWRGESVVIKKRVYLHGVCKVLPFYSPSGKRSIKEALKFAMSIIPFLSREDGFDVLEINQFPFIPFVVAKMLFLSRNYPLILTVHEVWRDYWTQYFGSSIKGWFGRQIEHFMHKNADRIIVDGLLAKKKLVDWGINPSIVDVIPNGYDPEEINNQAPFHEEFDVLYVGRLIPHKNVDILIKSIKNVTKEMPQIKCAIVGDGPQMLFLKNLVRKLNLEKNVKFMGEQRHSEVISIMKSSKILVLPSIREGFPLVIPEAGACNLPVITTNHPMNGARFIVINEVSGCIGSVDTNFFATKIIELMIDEERRKVMAKNARYYTKKYTWEAIISKVIKSYKTALKPK